MVQPADVPQRIDSAVVRLSDFNVVPDAEDSTVLADKAAPET